MAELGRQKDAMDVLQAWVNDYNAGAGPAIRLGSAGEAGGGRPRLKYTPPGGEGSILHMVAGSRGGRPALLGRPVDGAAAETAGRAGRGARARRRRRAGRAR